MTKKRGILRIDTNNPEGVYHHSDPREGDWKTVHRLCKIDFHASHLETYYTAEGPPGRNMRSEADTPVEERFLMILGRLSEAMIRELEDEKMPFWIDRARQRGEEGLLAQWEDFARRDRRRDRAFYTLYAYADIPLGRRYDSVFHRDGGPAFRTGCSIEHALSEGWFPAEEVGHDLAADVAGIWIFGRLASLRSGTLDGKFRG